MPNYEISIDNSCEYDRGKIAFYVPERISYNDLFCAVEEFRKIKEDPNGKYIATLHLGDYPQPQKKFNK